MAFVRVKLGVEKDDRRKGQCRLICAKKMGGWVGRWNWGNWAKDGQFRKRHFCRAQNFNIDVRFFFTKKIKLTGRLFRMWQIDERRVYVYVCVWLFGSLSVRHHYSYYTWKVALSSLIIFLFLAGKATPPPSSSSALSFPPYPRSKEGGGGGGKKDLTPSSSSVQRKVPPGDFRQKEY